MPCCPCCPCRLLELNHPPREAAGSTAVRQGEATTYQELCSRLQSNTGRCNNRHGNQRLFIPLLNGNFPSYWRYFANRPDMQRQWFETATLKPWISSNRSKPDYFQHWFLEMEGLRIIYPLSFQSLKNKNSAYQISIEIFHLKKYSTYFPRNITKQIRSINDLNIPSIAKTTMQIAQNLRRFISISYKLKNLINIVKSINYINNTTQQTQHQAATHFPGFIL